MRIYFSALAITLMTACASESAREPLASGFTACPPKPDASVGDVMCTTQYDPVCGSTAAGQQTFSNSCNACASAEVSSYKKGACE